MKVVSAVLELDSPLKSKNGVRNSLQNEKNAIAKKPSHSITSKEQARHRSGSHSMWFIISSGSSTLAISSRSRMASPMVMPS
jgi:hypothetical protein